MSVRYTASLMVLGALRAEESGLSEGSQFTKNSRDKLGNMNAAGHNS